jgi:hypothetical protein
VAHVHDCSDSVILAKSLIRSDEVQFTTTLVSVSYFETLSTVAQGFTTSTVVLAGVFRTV